MDYENLEEKYSETGKMTWEEEDIINNYKGIHSMLMSELPQCISLSWQWLHNILLTFMALQKELSEQGQHVAETQASEVTKYLLICCLATLIIINKQSVIYNIIKNIIYHFMSYFFFLSQLTEPNMFKNLLTIELGIKEKL